MQSAKILSVASTKLAYSVPIEMPESVLLERNFLRAKQIEEYFLWLLVFMGAAWCVREADDLAFNKFLHVDPFIPSLKYIFPNYFQLFPAYLTFVRNIIQADSYQ
jgi:hypothetical protein